MRNSSTLQYSIPYKNIIVIALITIPLFGISGAAPMPLLLSGNITWHEARFGFFTVSINVLSFWIINTLLIYFFSRQVDVKYHWLRYLASLLFCAIATFLVMNLIKVLKLEPFEGMHPFSRFSGHLQRRHFADGAPLFQEPKPLFHLFQILPGQSTNILILIILEVILLRNRKNTIEKENDLLRMANLEAKHTLLKQQLHPHFLFNSLSVLKALIKKEPVKADNYVDKLSELLRYSVYSSSNATVTIEEELKLVATYLDMQKIRFQNSLTFSFDIPIELMKATIPINSIQLLAENALKHNIFTETQPLSIYVKGNSETKTITIKNNLQPKPATSASKGLGLKNLKERYKLLGGRTIDITQTHKQFTVSLKIIDNESNDN